MPLSGQFADPAATESGGNLIESLLAGYLFREQLDAQTAIQIAEIEQRGTAEATELPSQIDNDATPVISSAASDTFRALPWPMLLGVLGLGVFAFVLARK